MESLLRTELFVDSCSIRHQGNCCASTREIRHLDLDPHATHREMFMRQDCCARTPQAHWISLRAQRDMFRRKDCCLLTLRTHLDLFPCAGHVHATRLLCSHAVSTLGSLSVRKETCFGEKTAAFSRREHTWISLRTQRDMFHRKDCLISRCPPR